MEWNQVSTGMVSSYFIFPSKDIKLLFKTLNIKYFVTGKIYE